jgi:tetratricopeptide (TPR) repeat protein
MGHRGSHLIGNRSEIGRCAARLSLRSSAVLLSVGRRGDPEQGSCSDGMPEEHTTERARLAGVLIIARNSGFTGQGEPVKPDQVSRALGVRLTPEEAEHRGGPSMDGGAQQLFDDGVRLYRNNTKGDNEMAQRRFRSVISHTNPGGLRPRAYAALAATYRQEWNFQWTANDPAGLRAIEKRAFDLATRSVAFDPWSPDGHIQLAYIHLYRMDHDQADEEARKAIRLGFRLGGVRLADGYAVLAQVLTYGGDPAIAVALMEKALKLVEPTKPANYLRQLGQAYYVMGQVEKYDAANPEAARGHYNQAKSWLGEAGNHRQALLTRVAVLMETSDPGDQQTAKELFNAHQDLHLHITIGQRRPQAPYKDPAMRERYIAALETAAPVPSAGEEGEG